MSAEMISPGYPSRHFCSVELPGGLGVQHGSIWKCSCGVLYKYDEYAEDSDGYWCSGWDRVDEHGCYYVYVKLPKKKWWHRREYVRKPRCEVSAK